MTPFLFGLGAGVGLYAAAILYVMVEHWRPTPWWGRGYRGSSFKTWKWNRRLISKRWPMGEWPRLDDWIVRAIFMVLFVHSVLVVAWAVRVGG